jgi:hypothetical protein
MTQRLHIMRRLAVDTRARRLQHHPLVPGISALLACHWLRYDCRPDVERIASKELLRRSADPLSRQSAVCRLDFGAETPVMQARVRSTLLRASGVRSFPGTPYAAHWSHSRARRGERPPANINQHCCRTLRYTLEHETTVPSYCLTSFYRESRTLDDVGLERTPSQPYRLLSSSAGTSPTA